MPENKNSLNTHALYTPIDYSGPSVPDMSSVHRIAQNFENWRKSNGYFTEEEKKKELEEKKKNALEKKFCNMKWIR